jgi:hypothetical protein
LYVTLSITDVAIILPSRGVFLFLIQSIIIWKRTTSFDLKWRRRHSRKQLLHHRKHTEAEK